MRKAEIIKAAYGAGGVLEGLITIVRCFGASAADVVWYISHILGLALPMPVALAIRAAILVTSGHCLLNSIKKISPKLYRKLQTA